MLKKSKVSKPERVNFFVPKNEKEREFMLEAVKGMLLSKCAEIFSSFEEDREQGRFRKNEIPPKDAIVYYEVKTDPMKPCTNVQAWHLEKSNLTELDDPNYDQKLNPAKTKSMYYHQASFSIRIEPEESRGYLSFTMGPLFGRGYMVDIKRTGDTPYLGEVQMQWIS